MLRSRGGTKGTLLAQKSFPSFQYHFIHRYKCGVGCHREEPRHWAIFPRKKDKEKNLIHYEIIQILLKQNPGQSEAGRRQVEWVNNIKPCLEKIRKEGKERGKN